MSVDTLASSVLEKLQQQQTSNMNIHNQESNTRFQTMNENFEILIEKQQSIAEEKMEIIKDDIMLKMEVC